jgi:hypothetical protein
MELTFECRQCEAIDRVPAVEGEYLVTCRSCSATRELDRSAMAGGQLSACPWCATEDLYSQKDFPQGMGLGIVIAGFVVSTYFWWQLMPIAAFAVLLASAALDLALFYLVPEVTICYRCLSQFRGDGSNVSVRFKPFDLAVGERYRQERLRIEELRSRPESL